LSRKPPPPGALPASPDEAETQFYEALQAGDLEKMMSVWADDEEVVCVHPGGERLIGPAAIRASFEAIFAQSAVPVQPDRVRRLHRQEAAVHHLTERVQVLTSEGTQMAWAMVTNVYVKTVLGWRMVAHHASPGQLGEPPSSDADLPATLH
jgi:uncharacterized protein (TIGR02246 family)